MLPQASTVQLTKIRYYNQPDNSREITDNRLNRNISREKSLFGHRWVLKINEIQKNRPKFQPRYLIAPILILLILTLLSSLYFTLETLFQPKWKIQTVTTLHNCQKATRSPTVKKQTHQIPEYCQNCQKNHVCLKFHETAAPQCVLAKDERDPTGCGGFCAVDTQFCQRLDKNEVFQCAQLVSLLECPEGSFNCGDRCIAVVEKCNGIVNCANRSDEIDCECNPETHFRCDELLCLPKAKQCDGVVHCWDKSDELHCYDNECEELYLKCRNGDCILREHFCDGWHHCSDQSDEPHGCQ